MQDTTSPLIRRALTLFLGFFICFQAQAQLQGEATYYADKFQGNLTANGERYDKYKLTAAHVSLAFGSWVLVTNLDNGKQVQVRINDRMPKNNKGRIIDLSRIAAEQIGLVQSGRARVQLQLMTKPANSGGIGYTNTTPITPRSRIPEPQANPLPADVPIVDLAGNPINDQARLTQPDLAPLPSTGTSRPAASSPKQANVSALPKTFKPGLFRMLAFEEEANGFGVQVGAYDDIYRLLEAMNSLSDKGYQNTLVQSGLANQQPIFRVLVGPYRSRSEADQVRKKLQSSKVKGIVVDLARLK